MKLLIITTSYPHKNEGMAAAGGFVRDFALALAELGHSITIVAPSTQASDTDEQGVRVKRFLVSRLPLSLLNPIDPRDWIRIAQTLRNGQNAVNASCTETRFDYIFALWALPSGAWAQRASKRFGIPFGIWALGSDIWSLGKIPMVRRTLRHVLRNAQQRFADGLQLARDVKRISGLNCDFLPSSRRLSVTDARNLHQGPPYRLVFLGRWHPNKGIDLLLEALRRLTDSDWQRIEAVRIYGGGPLEALVHEACGRLISQGRPLEIGHYVNQVEATELLSWADFVLIPSRIESIPVIFSDAMQVRRPVITMPVGDLPALIKKYQCGIVAEKVGTSSLANAIQKALREPTSSYIDGIKEACLQFDTTESARQLTLSLKGLAQ